VYVAPLMMSMFALCACNASVRSIGPTTELMYADSARSVGSVTAWTSLMCPLEITTRTTTSPKRLAASGPVKVPLTAADAEGDGDGDGEGAGVAEGEGDASGVAKGEAGGLGAMLPALGVGGTAATAPNRGGAIL
jgi:hypothetical protein